MKKYKLRHAEEISMLFKPHEIFGLKETFLISFPATVSEINSALQLRINSGLFVELV